jgi:zinc/manganese transport system substrate-binding protein
MTAKNRNTLIGLLAGILIAYYPANAAIKVVASLPDLGSIAAYIGGDKVEISSIAKANTNPHSVEVFPSYMAKVARAALYLKCGLALDQWADAIIDGSRNNHLVVIDCSAGIDVLEKPTGKVDASKGDVHPYGNPHYWLNPANSTVIAQNVLEGLCRIDPANVEAYKANFEKFKAECELKITSWKELLKPLQGKNIISYHSSWVYFANVFGLTIAAMVEPFPGIPPTGKHLAELVNLIKEKKAVFIIQEPYFSDDAPKFLSRQTGIKIFKFAPACSGVKPVSYFDHFEDIINQINGIPKGK